MKTTYFLLLFSCAAIIQAAAQTDVTNTDTIISGPPSLRNNPNFSLSSYARGSNLVVSGTGLTLETVPITTATNLVVERTSFSLSSQSITLQTNDSQVIRITNAFTEIGVGMQHQDPNGEWLVSSE